MKIDSLMPYDADDLSQEQVYILEGNARIVNLEKKIDALVASLKSIQEILANGDVT